MQHGTSAAAHQLNQDPYGGFVPGEVIAGKYIVERVIGVGGVGVVLAARHAELDEIVAIKFLLPEMQSRADIVARFANEARAAVRIKSEYAARVFDVGVLPDRGPYLVMEYLEGETLAAVLERGPIQAKRSVELMLQVCEALAVAHSCGIIHRDIKPENLFLSRRGDGMEAMKVLDFGISKAALTGGEQGYGLEGQPGPMSRSSPPSARSIDLLVKTQELMGTPLYMSPEQIRSTATVDHRSDIWSLGVVFYEMLTCQIPFPGETVPKICARVLETEPAPLHSYAVGVPNGLQAVLDRCFQKDPSKRFQNVAELAIALLPFGPSRARVFAERASSILEASGQSSGITFRFSSAPPPSLEPSVPTIPGAPPTPRFASGTAPILASYQNHPATIHPSASSAPEAIDALARESRKTRRTVVAAMALFVGLLGLGASLVMRSSFGGGGGSASPGTTASPATSASAVTAAAPPPAPAPGIGAVTISLGAKPSEAKLYLDDTLLPSNPLKRTVMRDGQPHAVRAEAFGYVTRSVAITFDSDKEVVLALDRSTTSAPPPMVVRGGVAPRGASPASPANNPGINPPAPSPSPPSAPVAAPPAATPASNGNANAKQGGIQEVDLPKGKKPVRPVDSTQPW